MKFGPNSACVKVLLSGIKIEVLPGLKEKGRRLDHEPFYIFDADGGGAWRQTYARRHQDKLSERNTAAQNMLVPMIKVMKHLRSYDPKIKDTDAPSFLLECLLYAIKPSIFSTTHAECVEYILRSLSGFDSQKAARSGLRTPCGDKEVFEDEWNPHSYEQFHTRVLAWEAIASEANQCTDKDEAIGAWQTLLGQDYFPREPA